MKRVLSILLLSFILVGVFASCSIGQGPELLSFIDTENTAYDLFGKTVVISTEGDYEDEIFEHKANTIMYDEILKRIREIGDDLNCDFRYICIPGTEGIERLMSLAATGDPEIDILYGHGYNRIGKLARAKALYPLTDLREYINYENSEKFGSAGLIESAMVNGIPYAVQPVQWYGFANSFAFHMAWNVDMFSQYGLPNLHEYYENGTWTWDTLDNLFDLYSKVGTDEIDLMAVCKEHFALISLFANDVKFCDYDGTNYYCDFTDQKTYTAAEWVLDMFNDNEDMLVYTDRWDVMPFVDEKALMVPAQSAAVTLVIPYSAEFKFGIMPFPCGPDATYGEWANYVEAIRGFAVSLFSTIPEAAAIIIDRLFEPFPEVNPSGNLADYYTEQIFYTQLDAEIFLDVGKYARNFYSDGNEVLWHVIEAFKSNTTASEIITTYAARVQNLVDEQIRPNYENFVHEHLYGGK